MNLNPPPSTFMHFFQRDAIIRPCNYYQLSKSDWMQLVVCPELQFFVKLKISLKSTTTMQ